MSEKPDNEPEVWGQLGTRGSTEHRKDEFRKRSERSDFVTFVFLVPTGLLLLVAGLGSIVNGVINNLTMALVGLGVVALGGAGKIWLGRR